MGETRPDESGSVAQPEPSEAEPALARAQTAVGTPGRILVWAGAGALVLLVLGAAWIVVTGLLARSQLQQIRLELPELRRAVLDGKVTEARRLADRIRTQADRAHSLTTGPAWWVTANLPPVGSPLRTTRVLASAADRLGSDVVPTVIDLAAEVSVARPTNSTIDLTRIERLAPQLRQAARIAHDVTRQVSTTGGSWLSPVSSARSAVLDQLTRVDGELTGADRAVRVAVPLLGGSRPQRYFVGFLNEAESRGLGGIPGAFAIATVDAGHVHFDHFGSDTEFTRVRAKVHLGADFDQLYGPDDPTGTYPNSDLSPDFRDAARIWAGLWKAKTGQTIDAAIAIDPTTLSYLLKVTGPARAADGEQITADNVVALTQRDQYRRFRSDSRADNAARKAYLVGIAKAVSTELTKGGDPHRLVRAISRAAKQRRFTIWSADPGVQRQLEAADWGGVLGAPAGIPYAGFTVINAAGNKLDYYLERRFSYRRTGCDAGSTATATLTLTNAAPAALPPYVTIRADAHPAGVHPGDNRLLVTYYGSAGARIRSSRIDGSPLTGVPGVENDLPVVVFDVELPRGATRTISVQVDEPAAIAPPTVLRQPLVSDMAVHIAAAHCHP